MAKYGIGETELGATPGGSAGATNYGVMLPQLGPPSQSIEHVDDMGSSNWSALKAGFIDDPKVMLKMFAQDRFPDEPGAVNRYGIAPNGLVYYRADDGKNYAEFPKGSSTWRKVLGSGGKMIPFGMGTGTGLATAPMLATPAAPASIALSAGAGAVGETIRQGIGMTMGDPFHSGEVAKEATFNALGQGMAKYSPIGGVNQAQKRAVRDLDRLDVNASNELGDVATNLGIRLSPAQQTNLGTLINRENVLRNVDESANIMEDFTRTQQEKVTEVGSKFLNALSPLDDARPIGLAGQDAAQAALARRAAVRAAEARPVYERAFANAAPVNIQPVVDLIDDGLRSVNHKGPTATALRKVRNLLADQSDEGVDFLQDNLEILHNYKMSIDDIMQGMSQRGSGNFARSKVREVQSSLLKAMDEASPDYGKARGIYHDLSPGVDAIREDVVGLIAGLKDKDLESAARKMFAAADRGPQTIRMARQAISREDPAAWNGMLKAYLEDAFVKAGKEYSSTREITNQGAKFAMNVMGTAKDKEMMRAAMTDAQWAVFEPMIKVFKATGRTSAGNSKTAFYGRTMDEMAQEGGGAVLKGMQVISGPMNFVKQYAQNLALGRNAEDMARRFTQPGAVNQLRELTKLPANSIRARVLVAQFLGYGASRGGEAIAPSPVYSPSDAYRPPNPLLPQPAGQL